MTGSSHPDIDAVVTLWNSAPTADVPDPHAAVVSQLQGDAALAQQLRDEVARITATGGQRELLHPNRPDAVSRIMHGYLTAILLMLGS